MTEPQESQVTNWHRLFGIVLKDFFHGTPFIVELEKDLSIKQQWLDVVIIRKQPGPVTKPFPDGLNDLSDHNLITFKSHQESLTDWSIKELIGHYVNYRKQVSPTMKQLLPETDFKLFAVSARFPDQIHAANPMLMQSPGVHQLQWGTDTVTVLVMRDLPDEEQNALLHLFSAVPKKIQYAKDYYRPQLPDNSTVLLQLLKEYGFEELNMPYTMKEYQDYAIEDNLKFILKKSFGTNLLKALTPENVFKYVPTKVLLNLLPAEEQAKDLTPEEIVKFFPPEKLLEELSPKELWHFLSPKDRSELLPAELIMFKLLPAEELLKGLPPEERLKGLPPEERLKGLPPEEIEAYLKKLKGESQNHESTE